MTVRLWLMKKINRQPIRKKINAADVKQVVLLDEISLILVDSQALINWVNMNIPDELKKTLLTLAKECEPLEMCGFVVSIEGKLELIHCENIAADPQNYFEFHQAILLRRKKKGKF